MLGVHWEHSMQLAIEAVKEEATFKEACTHSLRTSFLATVRMVWM